VQYEVDLAAEDLGRFGKKILDIFEGSSIGWDNLGIALLGQIIDRPHTHRDRRIGEDKRGTFFLRFQRYFPGNGIFVQCT
jgi:hypothetical protein